MRRREFFMAIAGVAAWPGTTFAQQQAVPVIGLLGFGPPDIGVPGVAAFRQGLRELGYIEDRNILIEYRWAEGKPERLKGLAAELVALKVDLIVTVGGTQGALAARQATATVPIVFTVVGDPIAEGLVASLARPGSNLTGLSNVTTDLLGKWLELLKEVVPRLDVVGLLLNPDSVPERAREFRLKEAAASARALGLQLKIVAARGPTEFDSAFSELTQDGAGALVVLMTPVFELERQHIVDLAAKNRLPAVYGSRGYVESGGLMSYGTNFPDLHRRAATYVDKILKGMKPADLPVQQPTKFELVVNLKTAKALGMDFPNSLLLRAEEVIE